MQHSIVDEPLPVHWLLYVDHRQRMKPSFGLHSHNCSNEMEGANLGSNKKARENLYLKKKKLYMWDGIQTFGVYTMVIALLISSRH